MTFVAEPDAYETAEGTTIRKEEIDLLSRMMSMQKIASELCDDRSHVHGGSSSCAGKRSSAGVKSGTRIPSLSVSDIRAEYWNVAWLPGPEKNELVIEDTFGFRTANLLMEGIASIRR